MELFLLTGPWVRDNTCATNHSTNSQRFHPTIALLCALLRVRGACNIGEAVGLCGDTGGNSAIADIVLAAFCCRLRHGFMRQVAEVQGHVSYSTGASPASPDCPMRAWHRVESHQFRSSLANAAPPTITTFGSRKASRGRHVTTMGIGKQPASSVIAHR
jgi:hypothetical protein